MQQQIKEETMQALVIERQVCGGLNIFHINEVARLGRRAKLKTTGATSVPRYNRCQQISAEFPTTV